MDLGLKGKTAIVTGGSKGIGLHTALLLAEEGANVVIVARGADDLEKAEALIKEKTGHEPLAIVADVTSDSDVEYAVVKAAERFGGNDILVNNAGTSNAAPFEKVEPAVWRDDLDLKLFGAIRFTQSALPYLKRSGTGAIVNVTPAFAKTPGASSLPTSVSRAAGLALTKALSRDLAADGIRVNTVCIGLIRSDQLEARWRREAPDVSWEQYARDPKHNIPLGRIGDTEEAARVIAFLVSGAASYVSGTAVNIDGGSAPAL
ncbi:SDR family NAD(P)-dependent oxidoreductase [Cohnella sp. GbtcB17]|uniref:SDR family NAD(P)-dependent oxidoreductase n=1 Tax=Cohnella sp. GbtcB17 TaxID=2824762 RepID=UPI001C3055D2|nr:SDR family oxidoreductase [Cohnella sp. GbtcB17]